MAFTAHNYSVLPEARAQPEPLPVKELADALGVGLRFVYQMRACGFPMRGDTRHQQMATLEEARAWIQANDFRLIKGAGVTGKNRSRQIPAGGMI